MKNKFKFLATMLIGILLSTNVWGETVTYTHDFTTTISSEDNTLSTITWTASGLSNVGGYNSSNYKGVQIGTSSKTGAVTLTSKNNWGAQSSTSYFGYTKVKKVYVWMNAGEAGSIAATVTIGGKSATSDGTQVAKNSSASSQRNGTTKVTFTPANDGGTGKIVIAVSKGTANKGAGYLCAIQVECEDAAPVVSRIVTWKVNNETYTAGNPTTQVNDGSKVTTLPTTPTIDCGGKTFVGWTATASYEHASDAPEDLFSTAADAPTVSGGNVTYYAVFADASGSGEVTYTKLSSNSFDATATYVLAAEESSSSSTLHYFSSYTGTTSNESWGVTSTTASDAITFTLGGTASALTAQDASGNYIEALATGKFKMSSTSTTLNLHDNGTIYNPTSGSTGYRLRYNHNNGSGGFRWYNGTTGTSAYFYKVEGGYSFSNYTTTCTSCTPAGTALAVSASPASITTSETSTLSTTGGNGGAVTYSVTSANASNAHIDGTTFSASVVGTYTITAHQDMNGDVCEQNATVNIEVTPAKHEVRWHVGGVVTTDEVAEGASITFPEAPSAPAACDEKSFYGWAKSEIVVETDDAPTVYTSETMSTADVDFYAVFANKEGSDPTLTKLGGSTTFTAGENIVVVASGDSWSRILYQETANTSYVNSKVVGTGTGEVALTAQGISADVKNYWTLSAGSNGTWILGDITNGYLLQKTSANEMYAAVSVPDVTTTNQWTIAWDETNSKFTLKASRYLCCRSDLSGSYQYKWRGNGINISQNGVYYCDIYQLTGGGATYSNYVTSCAVYNVTFKSNGADVTTVNDVAPGQQVTAPTLTEIEDAVTAKNVCTNYLVGWSTDSHYTNPSAAPSDILKPNAEGKITIPSSVTGDVTYHAVYADVVGE